MNETSGPQDEKPPAPRLLVVITLEEDRKKLEEILKTYHVPVFFQVRGKGTAPSEMMDIFGLGGITRLVTFGVMSAGSVHELFGALNREISVRRQGRGIACTIPVTGLQNHVLRMIRDRDREEMEKASEERVKVNMAQEKGEFTAIITAVDVGYSEDVVDAAKKAGARGGTVLKGRRQADEKVASHFGITVQDEEELVLIIVPREKKSEVMGAIHEECGLRSQAHGILFTLPIEDTIGLES